jgi:hypothetical protein
MKIAPLFSAEGSLCFVSKVGHVPARLAVEPPTDTNGTGDGFWEDFSRPKGGMVYKIKALLDPNK